MTRDRDTQHRELNKGRAGADPLGQNRRRLLLPGDPAAVDERFEILLVDPDEPPDLHDGEPSRVDLVPDVADGNVEALGRFLNREEPARTPPVSALELLSHLRLAPRSGTLALNAGYPLSDLGLALRQPIQLGVDSVDLRFDAFHHTDKRYAGRSANRAAERAAVGQVAENGGDPGRRRGDEGDDCDDLQVAVPRGLTLAMTDRSVLALTCRPPGAAA